MKLIMLAAYVSLAAALCVAQAQSGKVKDGELLACVRSGDEGCVARALAEGADPDAADEKGVPVLATAAEGRSARVVSLLLDAGADVNRGWQAEGAPLCRAALFGRAEAVNLLLEKGAKINVVCDSDHGDTPLMDALRGVMFGGMPGDLKEGLAADSGAEEDDGDDANNEGEKLREVLNAPAADFVAIARRLLARGADPNVVAKCDVGETALYYAALGASVEMVRELLARGADANRGTPLLAALRELDPADEKMMLRKLPALSREQSAMLSWGRETAAAREEIRRMLRAAGAKEVSPDDEDEASAPDEQSVEEVAEAAFDDVIEQDDVEDFRRLVEAYAAHPLGAVVLPEALRTAVIYRRTAMVKILLERVGHPNPVRGTPRGYTPLMQAAQDGNAEYVRMLLDAGADVNAANDDGKTALDMAEGWGSSEEHRAVVELLHARGARRGAPTKK